MTTPSHITYTPNAAAPASVTVSTNGTAPLVAFSREQVDLIKRTLCPQDTTDDELKLFLHVARESGLDPLRRQIHCTKRKGRLAIIAGIEGLMARASQQPDFRGVLGNTVCQKDEFLFDGTTNRVVKHTVNPFGERGALVGAWATVLREGLTPYTVLVRFAEFNQTESPTWRAMPHQMILKVAKSQALRAAYPERFGSVYEPAEAESTQEVFSAPATEAAPLPPHNTVHGVFNKREVDVVDVLAADAEVSDAHLTPEEEAVAHINESPTSEHLRGLVGLIQRLGVGASPLVRDAFKARQKALSREGK